MRPLTGGPPMSHVDFKKWPYPLQLFSPLIFMVILIWSHVSCTLLRDFAITFIVVYLSLNSMSHVDFYNLYHLEVCDPVGSFMG